MASLTPSHFPIRELSARTKVNSITLRAWERRYGLLQPARTAKGHRLYNEADAASVKKILALVARGVPLRKVKPLLQQTTDLGANHSQTDKQQAIDALCKDALSFSAHAIQSNLHKNLARFTICRISEALIVPTMGQLKHQPYGLAAADFLSSEVIKFSHQQLGNYQNFSTDYPSLILIAGTNDLLWQIALSSVTLAKASIPVQFIQHSLALTRAIEMSQALTHSRCVYFKDGMYKDQDQLLANDALRKQQNFFMCGTAAILLESSLHTRVFNTLELCTEYLTESNKAQTTL